MHALQKVEKGFNSHHEALLTCAQAARCEAVCNSIASSAASQALDVDEPPVSKPGRCMVYGPRREKKNQEKRRAKKQDQKKGKTKSRKQDKKRKNKEQLIKKRKDRYVGIVRQGSYDIKGRTLPPAQRYGSMATWTRRSKLQIARRGLNGPCVPPNSDRRACSGGGNRN